MRKLQSLYVATCLLLLASCSNPVENTLNNETYEKSFSFSFTSDVVPFIIKSTAGIPFFDIPDPTSKSETPVDPPSPPSPALPTLAAPVVIQKFLYSNEMLLTKGSIHKAGETFPSLTERFNKGSYEYIFVAHSQDTIDLSNNILTFDEVPDVFRGTEVFDIPTDQNTPKGITLNRCIARIEIISTMPTPDNVQSISIKTTNFINSLDIKNNCATKPQEYIAEKSYSFNRGTSTKNTIPTDNVFSTGFNTFILPHEHLESNKLALEITITYADNKTITHRYNAIDPIVNKVILYKGNIFSEEGNFNFEINADWSETEERPI